MQYLSITCILEEKIIVSIDKNEFDILKIYLAQTKEGTVHNLMVAYQYFKETKQENKLQVLLKKVEKMSASEFLNMLKHYL